jgi:predicted dehydrogenase
MRVLVTGRGSIARRHVKHLRDEVPSVELGLVAGTQDVDRSFQPCTLFSNFEEAMQWLPDAVIIASISSKHARELGILLKLGIPVLAEKPLVVTETELIAIYSLQKNAHNAVLVGCNLRYLPSLQVCKNILDSNKIGLVVRAHFEAGQDLRQWRPQRNLLSTYSANAAQGGGPLFDLVHDVDMASWMLGSLKVRSATSTKQTSWGLSVEDVHVGLLTTTWGAPVTISLDYVSQKSVRRYCFVGTQGTLIWDLNLRQLTIQDVNGIKNVPTIADDYSIDNTYAKQMRDWLYCIEQSMHQPKSSLNEALVSTSLMLDLFRATQ